MDEEREDYEDVEDFVDEEHRDQGYGFCPDCGTPLESWGAASHEDGDIFDDIGCPVCGETKKEIHASYCTCDDCYDRNL
jgi:hypothetical protein